MTGVFNSILFIMRAESRFWLLDLARIIKAKYGSALHCYCSGPEEIKFYQKNAGDLFQSFHDCNMVLREALRPIQDRAEVIARAQAWERRVGHTMARLSVGNRHLGRGYALGGFHHPRSRYSDRPDMVGLLQGYANLLDFWDQQFRDQGITLVINPTKESALLATEYGVPVRGIIHSRYKSFYNWTHNEYFETPAFEKRFLEIDDADEPDLERPYTSANQIGQSLLKQSSFHYIVKLPLMTTARYAYWNLRGYEKAKGYYYSSTMAYHYRRWRSHRWLRRNATTTLDDLKDQPFVFFPLATEPELSLQTLSPEYFFQLSSIAAISRDLPAGVVLVVKETLIAIGRRPDNFYEQIRAFKNVVLLESTELGLDIVRNARVTITITGTAGLEAAAMGRPVISFGLHNIYNFLPHVHVVTDQAELEPLLRTLLAQDEPTSEITRRDGRRMMEAIARESFDMGDFWSQNPKSYPAESIQDGLLSLEQSLGINPASMDIVHAKAS